MRGQFHPSPNGRGRLFAMLAAAAIAAFASAALAQPAGIERRQTGARTVFGSPNAQACADAAIAGRSDDEALAACTRALAQEQLSRNAEIITQLNRGAMLVRRKQGAEALAEFESVLELEPENPDAHLNRGAALALTGQAAEAVAALTTALRLGVANPHIAYFNRGAAREALGDLRGAFEDYTTALEIRPEWAPAEAELARFARVRRDALAVRLAEDEAIAAEEARGQSE